jgi:putative FmdB family regulatory protein
MPLYEFVCPICGARFERRISYSEGTDGLVCPNGHQHVLKVYSKPAIIFKGSGWYSTDHRAKPASQD